MLISERPQTKTGTKIDILPLNRRQRQILITAALLVGDFLTLIAAFSLAYILRFILLPYERTFSVEGYGEVVRTFSLEGYVMIVVAIIPLWLLIFAINQLYSSQILFGGFEEYIAHFLGIGAFSRGHVSIRLSTFHIRSQKPRPSALPGSDCRRQ
jgi:hypothetical protein